MDFSAIREMIRRETPELVRQGTINIVETGQLSALVDFGLTQVRAYLGKGVAASAKPGDQALLLRASPSHPWVVITVFNTRASGVPR